jgi:hypothetical protein
MASESITMSSVSDMVLQAFGTRGGLDEDSKGTCPEGARAKENERDAPERERSHSHDQRHACDGCLVVRGGPRASILILMTL